jgi:hypothetical protein
MKNKRIFDQFLRYLQHDCGMDDNPEICFGEKLMIFIDALTGTTSRKLKSNWNHSTSTISNTLHEVAEAILRLEHRVIIKPTAEYLSDRIRNNPKFWPYFRDCIGALDGTHLNAVVEYSLPAVREACMCRKGRTQNVIILYLCILIVVVVVVAVVVITAIFLMSDDDTNFTCYKLMSYMIVMDI